MPTLISGSTGVNKIQDGTITNADINASAGIDDSKLTGVFVEGSNSNGRYIKFADGTLMQWCRFAKTGLSFNDIGGNWFRTANFTNTFPIAFYDTNVSSFFTSSRHYVASLSNNGGTISTTTYGWLIKTVVSGSSYDVEISALFIGRWKA